MNNTTTFLMGIIGIGLFLATSIIGGLLIDNYAASRQLISEVYAIDTEYGLVLRSIGIIPSGILLTLFTFGAHQKFPQSKQNKIGFYGLGLFYGIATILVGIFPCDSGCNKALIDPSVAQLIHNVAGFLTYTCVPICLTLIGMGLKKTNGYNRFASLSILTGFGSILLVFLFFSMQKDEYIGLYQRMPEGVFAAWLIYCSYIIKNQVHEKHI